MPRTPAGPLTSFLKGKQIPAAPLSATGNTSTSTNNLQRLYCPSTNEIRQTSQAATSSQILQAIADASTAQHIWCKEYTPSDRAHVLETAATLIEQSSDDLSILESTETGRVLSETSSYDIPTASESLRYHASLLTSNAISTPTTHTPTSIIYTQRQPLGVTLGLGAWNYPLVNAITKSAPALAFGNAMIYKPSEVTPSTTLELAHIYHEAGVPPGVFQVLLGDGDVGRHLVEDTSGTIQKVSMTGSVSSGQAVYGACATNLNSVTLELGGKSPLIICEDCNVDQAVAGAMLANWYSNGQVCSNGTRVYVHEEIATEFIETLLSKTKDLVIGLPLDPKTDIGPMITKDHMEHVLNYTRIGIEEDGATLLYGGEHVMTSTNGYYLSPAIFVDCTPDMRIVQEEVFGMLMTIQTFTSYEDVIEQANDSKYGLAAGIFTKDLQRAHGLAQQLDGGNVWINNYNIGLVQVPWGGFRHSGVGYENGILGAEAWTKVKSIHVELDPIMNPYDKQE